MMRKARALLLLLSMSLAPACATVQPWERETLSAQPMTLEDCRTHRFERNIEVYREGAVGANGGKSGGGCGCS